jgi:hypothetical protein
LDEKGQAICAEEKDVKEESKKKKIRCRGEEWNGEE